MNAYAHIMNHPHYSLQHHRPMEALSRAAQFSAFAALTGFDEDIDEAGRRTAAYTELCEDDADALNAAFRRLLELESERPEITVTYFQPDARKSGGVYRSYTGQLRFVDTDCGLLHFTDGHRIEFAAVTAIQTAT